MARDEYDLVTIGAGSGGVRASRLAGGYGAKVALCEQSRVGGTCVLRGCVPKKLLVYGAHYAEDFADARGYGWTVEGISFDGVYRRLLRDNGVEIVEGTARLVDPHTVAVAGRTLTAKRILVATGAKATLPAVPGIEHAITSNEALDLPALPRRVVIVGGGYIAVEFAGIFAALGSTVTLVMRADNPLRGFDQDIRVTLAAEMEKKAIRFCRHATVQAIEKTSEGACRVQLATGEALTADVVLYATGRVPNTRGLGLEDNSVRLNEKGAVVVDSWNRSTVDSIFAVGDCTDRLNLTPVAIAEGRAFSETHFNNTPIETDHANVASAVFSIPPVATVGQTEEQARARGDVQIFLTRFKGMRHTLSGRDERTMMKLVVDRATDRVLGCHMVGADAPEIIQGLAVALKCGATKRQFDATIGIHPTAAEEFVTLRAES
ncbi:MAG: glutathione reductase (NADPH) [Rhodospirillaceae bacterium]|nr:MAG: glutathione reductase (NADPH) [Rhodospirillaceae bacterium]